MTVALASLAPAGILKRGAPAPSASRNLLLVTLDTTRADHLGCYGDARAQTPRLDRLASEGARVETAIAVAPLTLPSHCTLLTGVMPPRHGVHDNADYRLPSSQPTLATHLRGRGYATAAVVASIVLQGSLGLSRGFDIYDEPVRSRSEAGARGGAAISYTEILERRAGAVTDAALSALGKLARAKPFFLWVHYYDPHAEYDPPSPWRERFHDRLYDGEIAYMDAQLGRLLDALEKDGRLDKTLVAVVADHGESLGEHGESTHGLFVYDATLRVPLILRMPGVIPPGTRILPVVSGADLAPTILDLLSQPPLPAAEGVSFAESARGRSAPPRPAVYSESRLAERAYGWAPLFSLRDAERRYVEAPTPELYDVRADPLETRNLAASASESARGWSERLRTVMRESSRDGADARAEMSPEDRERLASLGYLSASGSSPRAGPGSKAGSGRRAATLADPKSRVALHTTLLDVKKMIASRDLEGARRGLTTVLAADPGNPAALSLRGVLDFSMGRRDEGLAGLRDAARRSPGVYENQANLANALHAAGRLEEAAASWKAALSLRPSEPAAHYALGNVLFAQHDVPGAVREYEESVRLGETAPGLLAALGVARSETGDAAGARSALKKALVADPGLAGAWIALGRIEDRSMHWSDAARAYDRALTISPSDPDALFGRARARLRLGDTAPAQADVRRLADAHPHFPALAYLRGALLAASGDVAGARRELTAFLVQPQIDPHLAEEARRLLEKMDRRAPSR